MGCFCSRGPASQINEIILIGNPVQQAKRGVGYHHAVKKRLPALKFLDRAPIRSVINFNLPAPSEGPALPSEKGPFFDSEQNKAASLEFVRKFFSIFDGNRQDLLEAYTQTSCFSLALSKEASFGSMGAEFTTKNRNLLALKGKGGNSKGEESASLLQVRHACIFLASFVFAAGSVVVLALHLHSAHSLQVGKINIMFSLDKLPQTQHQFDDFVVDAFVLPSKAGMKILHVAVRVGC